MSILAQPQPAATPFPGIAHATWAGQPFGQRAMSLWRQSMAPGSATPLHSHDTEELVMVTAGSGEVVLGDARLPFAAPCTLAVPPHVMHQIVNTGAVPLETTAVFAGTPVNVFGPDGVALALPWAS